MKKNYDLIIIGSGPGGYVSAIKAAQVGLSVAIIEKDKLGGICLNWGCIPTKSLLKTAEIIHQVENIKKYGLALKGEIKIDIDQIVDRSRNVAKKLSSGVTHLLKKNKVDVFFGYGKILSKTTDRIEISIKNDKENINLTSKYLIISSGARAKTLKNLTQDNKNILSYKEAMIPKKIPKSLLIIGSGAIGIEFASIYNDLGVDVSIIELEKNILPAEDKEISNFAKKSFSNRGIKIFNEANLKEIKEFKDYNECLFEFAGELKSLKCEKVLVSIGIEGNIEDIGLENTKIKTDKGHIVTNDLMETNEKNIYAIGDVTGPPWLAHKASHEGIICIEHIIGNKNIHKLDRTNIPGCTYSRPQIASIGLTEEKAKEKGINVNIGKFPFNANGKALASSEEDGFIKTIFDKNTGALIGAHLIGHEVTELINSFAIAKSLETTEEEIMNTVFPHPTLSEAIHESVLDAFNKAIHI